MTCKTCALWDRPSVTTATGRLKPRAYARCLWTAPEITLPDSVREGGVAGYHPPRPTFMGADDGETCPAWERRA